MARQVRDWRPSYYRRAGLLLRSTQVDWEPTLVVYRILTLGGLYQQSRHLTGRGGEGTRLSGTPFNVPRSRSWTRAVNQCSWLPKDDQPLRVLLEKSSTRLPGQSRSTKW